MNKGTKIWLIVGTVLVILGLVLFGVVMNVNNWDFTKLGTVEYETNTWEVDGEFHNISIDSDTADIEFVQSEDGVGKVVCHESTNDKHEVLVQDGTLTIRIAPGKKWYENITIMSFESAKITVYLPENDYLALSIEESTGDILIPKEFKFENIDVSTSTGDVQCFASAWKGIKIKVDTGDIRVENVSTDTMELSVSTGDANVTSVFCNNFVSDGDTGKLSMKNVVAMETIAIERDTGDVLFDKCDAAELYIETDTGYVKGSLLSDKIFFAETDTGRVDVPKTMTGGKCEVKTDTGDIKITIEKDHTHQLLDLETGEYRAGYTLTPQM